MIRRICHQCHLLFDPRVPWQRFHAQGCRDAYHNQQRYRLVQQARRAQRKKQDAARAQKRPANPKHQKGAIT